MDKSKHTYPTDRDLTPVEKEALHHEIDEAFARTLRRALHRASYFAKLAWVLGLLLATMLILYFKPAQGQELPSVFSQRDTASYYVKIIPVDRTYNVKGWIQVNDSTRIQLITGEIPLVGPPKPTLWQEHKPFWKAAIGAVSIVLLWGLVS